MAINDKAQDAASTIKTASQRHIHLDVLRGFAVMGILTMNITAFAMPQNAYLNPITFGSTNPSDIATWIGNFIIFDGKMRGLFSLLFGASMMLIIMRADEKGESSAKIHYNRMIWLILFGIIHFAFIWYGDILFLYGVMGCLAYMMHHLDAKHLLKWGIGIFLAMTFIITAIYSGILYQKYMAEQDGATASEISQYQDFLHEFSLSSDNSLKEIAAYEGSYGDAVRHRVTQEWSIPIFGLFIGFTETFPFMLIGMALLKNGFLLGQSPPHIYKRSIIWLLLPGAILYALLSVLIVKTGFDLGIAFNASQAWSAIARLMMTVGYAALAIIIIDNASHNSLIIRIGAAGRMAFSNYIGTSVVMAFIFYGYGFGMFGNVSRAGLIPYVIGAWIVMLLWSKPWLMRFQYGPLEWLWRSLSRRQLQKFTR